MRDVARCGWLLRQRASRPVGAPKRDADELGDALEPLLVEITHGMVAKDLPRRDKAACASIGPRRAWDDESAGVSDGVVVRPSRRTDGCSDEAHCSWPAGPVAMLATGEGAWRAQP